MIQSYRFWYKTLPNCATYFHVNAPFVACVQYHLSPVIIGVVFLVGPGVYALAAPMWGWVVDKKVKELSLRISSVTVYE